MAFIVFTDSNGRGATHDSIMNHVPKNERGSMEIEVVVAYTLDEAYRRIEQGEFRMEGAVVLLDNLTNDVRGTRSRPSVTPQQLLRLIDGVRRKVMAAGAAAVVTCQLKPMQTTDVTAYNEHLENYLRRAVCTGAVCTGCVGPLNIALLKRKVHITMCILHYRVCLVSIHIIPRTHHTLQFDYCTTSTT